MRDNCKPVQKNASLQRLIPFAKSFTVSVLFFNPVL